ncbi:hypothetical protein [Micromonospora sp. NPDC005206]|uniref:hypothetical protein n=1 Tax=Micromonospora sp. NPDC005206 TaxID=3157022 RepID=UPI0033BC2F1B
MPRLTTREEPANRREDSHARNVGYLTALSALVTALAGLVAAVATLTTALMH